MEGVGGRTPGSKPRSWSRARTLPSTPSTPQGCRSFLKARMGPGAKNNEAWSGDEVGVDHSCGLFFFFPLPPAGKQSSVLNWQDCEVPSPQPHSPEPSSQCVAAPLYPLPQQPPISLPRSPGPKTGPPAQ